MNTIGTIDKYFAVEGYSPFSGACFGRFADSVTWMGESALAFPSYERRSEIAEDPGTQVQDCSETHAQRDRYPKAPSSPGLTNVRCLLAVPVSLLKVNQDYFNGYLVLFVAHGGRRTWIRH